MKSQKKPESKGKLFNSIAISLIVLVAVIVVGGLLLLNKNKSVIHQLNSENTELGNTIVERDSLVNDLISSLDTIESNLTFINERRGQLVLENSETSLSKNESIIKDIQLMNEMLEESSKKIEELEKKFEKSGIQLKSFRNKIAKLNKRIEQQNNQIADLHLQVEEQRIELARAHFKKDSLQKEVVMFQDAILEKEEIIEQKEELITLQDSALNQGYFAYGTIKELTENGVIAKRGGFLGLGKSRVLHNSFNEEYFTQVDIRENKTIQLNAKRVNLISEHPVHSYKLIEEDGLITSIEIETPEDFWKVSSYAVIEVKL